MKENKLVILIFTIMSLGMFSVLYALGYSGGFYLEERELSLVVFGIVFCIFLGLYFIKIKPASLTTLFFVSFSVFMFGRYFAKLMYFDADIFSLNFFYSYSLGQAEATQLTLYLTILIISIFLGVLIRAATTSALKFSLLDGFNDLKNKNIWFFTCAILAFISYVYTIIGNFLLALDYGYLSLYSAQAESYSGANFSKTFFYVMLGLSFAFNMKKEKKLLIFGVAIVGLLSLFSGQRSAFIVSLLLFLWIYGKKYDLGWIRVAIYMFAFFVVLITLGVFSARELDVNFQDGIINVFLKFIYDQGISLMVFDVSTKIDEYPLLATIQNFIPGASKIASFFYDVSSYEVHYANYLAYSLDSYAYLKGQGLGWSLPGTFYIWSQGNIVFLILLSIVFGYALRMLDDKSYSSRFFEGMIASIFASIILLPRGQFSNVIPGIIYFYVFYIIFKSFFFARKKVKILQAE